MADDPRLGSEADLRERALALLAGGGVERGKLSDDEIQRLVFELQVHQVELELQNDELRAAYDKIEESRRRYADLYNFAPVGYLTLDREGIVREANFTAAELLGIGRRQLLGQPIALCAARPDRDAIYLHLRRLFETRAPQRIELQLQRGDGSLFWAQLDSVVPEAAEGELPRSRTTLLDIGDRKVAEQLRLRAAIVEHSRDPIIELTLDEIIVGWNPAATRLFGYSVEQISGQPISALFQPDRPRLFDPTQIEAGGMSAEFVARPADGRELYVAVTASPVQDERGALRGISLNVRDVTARTQAQAAEREQQRFTEALAGIAQAINRTLRLDEVLDLILADLERVVAYDVAEVMLFSNGTGRVARSKGYETRGLAETVAALEFSVPDTPNLNCLTENNEPLLIPDVAQYEGWIQVLEYEGLRSYVGVPIRVEDETIGCLNVLSDTPGHFGERDARRLLAFADHAAIAIHNAQLFAQAEEAGVLRERNRLARDLHDAVTQTLFSASLLAELLPHMAAHNPEALPANLHSLHLLTRSALAEMRTLLLELRPDGLARQPLAELIQQLVDAIRGRRQIEPQVRLARPEALPPEVSLAFFRVAQEALNNVAKHSKATALSVILSDGAASVALVVEDNGVGFDASQQARGMGLESMRERAGAIGAEITIGRGADGGTRVELVWNRTVRRRVP